VIGFMALLVLATVLRRPDVVTNPQFWAEDGHFWFADAHNLGPWTSLIRPQDGYIQTLARLTGVVSLPFGLRAAPYVFNLVALIVQILPAFLVITSRFERAIPSRRVRFLLGAVYIAIPNFEVHGNVTNAQWHLALLAFMILAAAPSRLRRWRVFDIGVLVLAGLSGPFVFLLAPVALVRWLLSRERRHLVPVAITAGLALVQGVTAVITISIRGHAPLGAGIAPALRILSDRVMVPALLGQENPALYTQGLRHGLLLAIAIAATGGALLIASLLRAPVELRLLNAFAFLSLLVALLTPRVSLTLPQWPLIAGTTAGARYLFLPVVAWMVTVVWGVSRLRPALRAPVGGVLAVVFCTGAIFHWQYPPYEDFRPATYARQYDEAPQGSRLEIPINPPGWTMSLTKH